MNVLSSRSLEVGSGGSGRNVECKGGGGGSGS